MNLLEKNLDEHKDLFDIKFWGTAAAGCSGGGQISSWRLVNTVYWHQPFEATSRMSLGLLTVLLAVLLSISLQCA